MPNILTVSGLCKAYDRFSLDHVSLTVSAGCITGFIGSNGAGKTSTIKAILGLITADEGSIELFGKPVCPGALPPEAKQRIGTVLDTIAFPDDCLVSDLGLIGKTSFVSWDARRFASLLDSFGISPNALVKSLSRGMGMKLQMAFALSHHPSLLILDEATAGLDPLARDEVLDLLREFMADEGCGILLSSHITSDLEKIADYVVCIDEGRVIFSKTIEEICDDAGIARCKSADVERILAAGVFETGSLRLMRGSYCTEVLVPNRTRLKQLIPSIDVERARLEDYMRLTLKGEVR